MRTTARTTPAARRGSALVLALIVVGTVTCLSAGYLMLASAVTRRQAGEVENLRAFYLAEAGLGEAYLGLRIGKTGRIGSAAAPAAYGQGMLWVDATELDETRVQLESTALCGSGRATLSLVVERVETPLGFFSEEELVVDDVLLVDGFDSQDGPYLDQVGEASITVDPTYPFLFDDPLNKLLFYEGLFYRCTQSAELTYWYDHVLDFTVLVDDKLYSKFDIDADDFMDSDWESDFEGTEYDGILMYFERLAAGEALASVETPQGGGSGTLAIKGDWVHTSGGGLLGSNAGISFQNSAGEVVEVYGDVIPGPESSVGGGRALITGTSEPREEAALLPEVELPVVELLPAVRHASAVPMIISPSTVGYERIDVAADAELIIRGPSTVVIGALVLEPGAGLTLDTQDGDVNLFITSKLDLEPGSVVTTSQVPQDLNVLVAAIPTVGGEAPVQLEAQSRFHGAIYAPDTEVRIGAGFEVFGGVVARRLDLAPGVRLHFDNAGFDGLPKLISWRIVEIPEGVRTQRGDPFVGLGIAREELPDLAQAHDLEGILLDVTYIDKSGAEVTYSGPEDAFDWANVDKVLAASRSGGSYDTKSDGSGLLDSLVQLLGGDGSSGSGDSGSLNSGSGSSNSGTGSSNSGTGSDRVVR